MLPMRVSVCTPTAARAAPGSCNTKVQTESVPKICPGGIGYWALTRVLDLEHLVGLCLGRKSWGTGSSSWGRPFTLELSSLQHLTPSPQFLRLMDSLALLRQTSRGYFTSYQLDVAIVLPQDQPRGGLGLMGVKPSLLTLDRNYARAHKLIDTR